MRGPRITPAAITEDEPETTATAILEQVEAVRALATMVEAGTPTGQAVLAAVQRDLVAAYDKLAAYVKRRG